MLIPARIRSLWRNVIRRQRVEHELDDEVRSYLEQLVEKNISQGMTPDESRRAAGITLGGVEQVKEQVRDARTGVWIASLGQDLRYGLRQLRRNPGFAAVAVITLALGIGANTAIFSLIDAVMVQMLPVYKPEQLLQVKIQIPVLAEEARGSFTNPLWEQVRDQEDVFSSVFAWGTDKLDLARGGAAHLANTMWVSGSFFNALGLHPAAGRLIVMSDDRRGCPAVAVLSYGFWQNHYGGENSVIGRSLTLNSHPFEVIGVAPQGFHGMEVGREFNVAAPICATAIFDGKESRLDNRSWWWLSVAGRIKPGISRSQVSARLRVLSPAISKAAVPNAWSPEMRRRFLKQTLVVVPTASGPVSPLRHEFDQPLEILMAVVGLVLLIACANLASLMLARAAARHKEIAMRQALGASRMRLVQQLLTECVALSSAGSLLGILFARWGTTLLVRYISTSENTVFLNLSLNVRVLAFTAGVAVLTGFLFGLLPALRSTRIPLISAMKGNQAIEVERRARFHTHKWMVVTQIALSFVLLTAASLLLRSFIKLATLDIGFDRKNVLAVSIDLNAAKVPLNRQAADYDTIKTQLHALPGVVSASRSLFIPMTGDEWNQYMRTAWSKGIMGLDALAWFNVVSPGYFQTLRMRLLAGRNFNTGDTKTSPSVAIINQTLARRFFPNLNPIGKAFSIDQISGQPGPPIEVVGIVNDAKYDSVSEKTLPQAFFPLAQATPHFQGNTFELRTAIPPSALIPQVQAAIGRVNKEIPLTFHTLAEFVNDSLLQARLLALLSGFFGALALLLAMVGLYGTFNYLVTQRQAEFGIRMALGAPRGSILALVMRDLIAVLAGGLVLGVLISLAATRVLQHMLFGLGPRDALTLVAAAFGLSVAALVAGYIPARRAARVDPVVALRHE